MCLACVTPPPPRKVPTRTLSGESKSILPIMLVQVPPKYQLDRQQSMLRGLGAFDFGVNNKVLSGEPGGL